MTIKILRRIKYGFASMPDSFYQFSALGFLYWAAMTGTSFTTVYLQELNFTSLQIGSMNAAFTTINIIAPPLWGVFSDKLRSIKKVFALCVLASAVVWFMMPHAVRMFSPLIVLLIIPVYRFVGTPTMTLLDGWIVRHVNNDRRVGFGAIRMWGSVGWAIVACVYGVLLRDAPLDIIFYGYALFAIPCVILALSIKENAGETDSTRRKLSLKEMQLSRIIKSKPLMAYLMFNLALYMPIMASFTFLPYIVAAAGGHHSYVGVIAGAEALFEIPLLFFSARLIKRFKTTRLIVFCALLYTIEVTLYGFCRAPWQILLVKGLHGLGYGLYLGCMVQYVYRLAPKGLTATAQTLIGCSNAIAGIIGNLIGGAVIFAFGVSVFFRFSGIFMVLVVAAYMLWLRKNGEAAVAAEDGDEDADENGVNAEEAI